MYHCFSTNKSKTVFVSSVSLTLKFRSCQGIKSIGYNHNVKEDRKHLFGASCERFLSDFSASIPLLDKFIFFNLVGRRDWAACHAASVLSKQGRRSQL